MNSFQSKKIAEEITQYIFTPVNKFKTTVFLCGGSLTEKKNIRHVIGTELKKDRLSYKYDIIFPEELFNEILYGNKKADLLSLENLLADSVDAIIIIPESPGSYSELGAFTNNKQLLEKIICIIDKKYEFKKSFINQGPIKLVKKKDKGRVLFYENKNIGKVLEGLRSSLNKIKNSSKKKADKINLLQFDNFLLFAIFILEPIDRSSLIELLANISDENEHILYQITISIISTLVRKNYINLSSEGYKLTQLGISEVYNLLQTNTRTKNLTLKNKLDNLRLIVLNSKVRNKKLRF
ncbi:MAG: retron St85 family effector protein [Ignavibacteria bacterium]|nr:retron St85 family effector protein [Ignavibacteria bacterium]